MATKTLQQQYAEWLLEGGYIPFAAPVALSDEEKLGYNGIRKDRAHRIASKAKHPLKVVAQAGVAELAIAESVVAGTAAPKAWPGDRPIAVMKAQKAAAKEAEKAEKAKD